MTENRSNDKSSLIGQLDRHLEWIKSCDTKSSIVLGVVGIFLTLFTSQHSINMLNDIFSKTIENINFSNFFYLVLFIISWCLFIYGAYSLIRVLIPRLSKEALTYKDIHADSLYFFENISQNTFSEYKNKVFSRKVDDEIDDILSQIYINAQICSIKYSLHYS